MDKIISKFQLENIIIKKISETLKEKNLTSDEIDKIYKNEMMTFYSDLEPEDREQLLRTLTQGRVATMGRLSELKVVNWEINKEGKSVYSLAK